MTRRLLLLLLLLCLPTAAGAQFLTVVGDGPSSASVIAQTKPGTDSVGTTSLVITFDSATITGRTIVVIARMEAVDGSSMATNGTVGGNSGDTSYTAGPAGNFGSSSRVRLASFYYVNITGRSGHALTLTPGENAYVTAWVVELKGTPIADPLTGTNTPDTATGTAATGGATTPSVKSLRFGAVSYDGAGTTIAPNWTGGAEQVEIDEGNATSGSLSVLTKPGTMNSADTPAWTLGASKAWLGLQLVIRADTLGGMF